MHVSIVELNWLITMNLFLKYKNKFIFIPSFFSFSVVSRQSRPSVPIQFCVCVIVFYDVVHIFLLSVNVNTSAAEERVLLTGLHEVADVYCDCCKTLLGWKYVSIVYWI